VKYTLSFVGQRLCLADKEHISGCGTYERNGYIYSTLAGVVDVVKEERVFIIFSV
jgi:exosome complex RNA-binding protein Rrp4